MVDSYNLYKLNSMASEVVMVTLVKYKGVVHELISEGLERSVIKKLGKQSSCRLGTRDKRY